MKRNILFILMILLFSIIVYSEDYTPSDCNTIGSGSSTGIACKGLDEDATDATHDGCTDTAGAGTEYVDNIYLNGTSFNYYDDITVTCEINNTNGWFNLNKWSIYYTNGSGWYLIDSGLMTSAGLENKSASFQLDNVYNNHSVRCQVATTGDGSVCDQPGQDDHDDMNFSVITPSVLDKRLISTVTGDTPFYTNGSNPVTLNLSKGESQLVTFYFNSTGTLNQKYDFFVYVDSLGETILNETAHWNGTIIIPPVLEVYPKGLISTVAGATPFYTNGSNPVTINLDGGKSELVTFWFNSTGDLDKKYDFFVFANDTSTPARSNITAHWNGTIVLTGSTPCSYTSGDFNVDCSNNCNFATNIDLGGNDFFFYGSGTMRGLNKIHNYNNGYIWDSCKVFT